ncbi:YraN family protein [Nocardioides jensenii]|uniref:YraN family protein n=1 Tax=Nocardioides jensenii TaxID=1843 RepID=UPI00082BF547|nr:YraN family protein [Nocardioides jensenii]
MGSRAARQQALGAYGEAIAAKHLVDRGMVLIDHNWRCPDGEIDLILRDGTSLVFCEVKTRRSVSHGTPMEAVTQSKFARMRRLAGAWMSTNDVHASDIRFDVVGIVAPQTGSPTVDHVAGVC